MGSTRSWGADHEDEDKTCRHGAVTKYFDRCLCPGCLADAAERTRVAGMVAQLKRAAEQALEKEAPERRQWRFEHFMKLLGGM